MDVKGAFQADLKQSVEKLRRIVDAAETQAVNVQSFLKIVKKYAEPTELTPALLREFVEKVVVYAPEKSSGRRVQRIDVHYTFIGAIDLSPECGKYEKETTARRSRIMRLSPVRKTSLSGFPRSGALTPRSAP